MIQAMEDYNNSETCNEKQGSFQKIFTPCVE